MSICKKWHYQRWKISSISISTASSYHHVNDQSRRTMVLLSKSWSILVTLSLYLQVFPKLYSSSIIVLHTNRMGQDFLSWVRHWPLNCSMARNSKEINDVFICFMSNLFLLPYSKQWIDGLTSDVSMQYLFPQEYGEEVKKWTVAAANSSDKVARIS